MVLLRALLQIRWLREHNFDWLTKYGVAQDKFALLQSCNVCLHGRVKEAVVNRC